MVTFVVAAAIGVTTGLVLGALGGGGGVLTVPALVYLLGESAHQAASASLVIVGIAALVGIPAHARSGNVRWTAGMTFGAVGTAAAAVGTLLSRRVDADVLLAAFSLVILISAALMIRDARRRGGPRSPKRSDVAAPAVSTPPATTRGPDGSGGSGGSAAGGRTASTSTLLERSTPPAVAPTPPPRHRALQVSLILLGGTAVGLMTGLFGVGGGFLAVPVLVLVMRWPMAAAIGTSLVVIVINSGASLALRASTEVFDWTLIAPVAGAAVVGVLLGKLVTDRVSGPRLAGSFAGLLVALACYTGVRSVLSLLD